MRIVAGFFGELSEWFMEAVLKTAGLERGSGGSNPSLSAEQIGDVLVLTAMLMDRKHAGLCR